MPIKEKISYGAAVSLILLALRFCVLPMLGEILRGALPFLVALAVAGAVLMPSRGIARALGLRVGVVGVVLTLLSMTAVSLVLFFALRAAALELGELIAYLSGEGSLLFSMLPRLEGSIARLGVSEEILSGAREALLSSLGSLLAWLGGAAAGALARLPSLLFFLFTSGVAAVYLILYLPGAIERLPLSIRGGLDRVRRGVLRGLAVYGRAYLILFFVTALLSLLALSVLGVRYPWLISLLLALVDLLPVLGVGIVLIPWALISLLLGQGGFALCLALLWAAVTVVRRILEDRLVGRGLGVHPLLALLGVCLGLQFFGAAGLFLGPLAVAFAIRCFAYRDGEKE